MEIPAPESGSREGIGTPRLTKTQLFGTKPCTNWGTPDSTMLCSGCRISDVGEVRVFYCSQKSHWSTHKRSCVARRRLGRSVSILRDLWTHFEKATFSFDEEFVREDENTVTLRPGNRRERALTGQSVFIRFPEDCVPHNVSDRAKMAMLFSDACSEPFTTGLSLLKLLIKDLGLVQQVCVGVKYPAMTIKTPGCDRTYPYHNVLKVTIRGNEDFLVDFTAGQYGWDEALIPWNVFVRARVSEFVSISPLEGTQIRDRVEAYSYYHPDHLEVSSFKLRRSLAGGVTSACKEFMQTHHFNLAELLNFPEPSFSEVRQDFVEHFKEKLHLEILRLHDKGIGRLYPAGDEVRVTTTQETAERCRRFWLSTRELERNRGNPQEIERLQKAWERALL